MFFYINLSYIGHLGVVILSCGVDCLIVKYIYYTIKQWIMSAKIQEGVSIDTPVKDLTKLHESETFDRTEGGQDNIGKTIAGFGTKKGGLLLVGQVDSKHGSSITGVDEAQFHVDFSNAIANVKPVPVTRTKIVVLGEKKIALVQVNDVGELRPCTYKGRYYERKGDSTRELQPEEVRKYHLMHGSVTTEELPTSASREDVDSAELEEYSRLLKRSKDNILDSVMAEAKLTVRGVVVLSKNPMAHLEGNFIEIQRYDNVIGSPPSPIGPPVKISRPARLLIEEATTIVSQNISVERKYEGAKMIETPLIPLPVIREVITNAVAHRNYRSNEHVRIRIFADCFDIANPAVVSETMWKDILATHTTYHPNQGIYAFLNPAQLYEGRGEGIWKIREELQQLSIAPPEFRVIGDVPSTFYAKIGLTRARTKDVKRAKLNSLLSNHKEITSSEVMKALHVSRVTAISMLNSFVRQGILEHSGQTRTSKYLVKNPQLIKFATNAK